MSCNKLLGNDKFLTFVSNDMGIEGEELALTKIGNYVQLDRGGNDLGRRRRRRSRGGDPVEALMFGFLMVAVYIYRQLGSRPWVFYGIIILGIGAVIYFPLRRKRAKEDRLRRSGIKEIDGLSGEDFEAFLAQYFEGQGYVVKTTPKYGDFGADLVLSKDGVDTVVQAKRWNMVVGIVAVQQIVAAKQYYGARNAMVITNSDYTPAAVKLAAANEITLWAREQLIQELAVVDGASLMQSPALAVAATSYSTDHNTACPRCGKAMVARSGRKGRFYGCSGYPACRYTREA